jgi:hypothetical protein
VTHRIDHNEDFAVIFASHYGNFNVPLRDFDIWILNERKVYYNFGYLLAKIHPVDREIYPYYVTILFGAFNAVSALYEQVLVETTTFSKESTCTVSVNSVTVQYKYKYKPTKYFTPQDIALS